MNMFCTGLGFQGKAPSSTSIVPVLEPTLTTCLNTVERWGNLHLIVISVCQPRHLFNERLLLVCWITYDPHVCSLCEGCVCGAVCVGPVSMSPWRACVHPPRCQDITWHSDSNFYATTMVLFITLSIHYKCPLWLPRDSWRGSSYGPPMNMIVQNTYTCFVWFTSLLPRTLCVNCTPSSNGPCNAYSFRHAQ